MSNRCTASACFALVMTATAASAGMFERSFLPLAGIPPNYVPIAGSSDVACGVAARGDGLVAVAGWTRASIFLIDARDPSNPRIICEQQVNVDVCGLAFDGDVLLAGGDDQAVNQNGLVRIALQADPFSACPTPGSITLVPGVSSGVTPNLFTTGGRSYTFIVNRWGYSNPVVDLGTRAVVGSWLPQDADARFSDAAVTVTSTGQVLAAVAALKGGVYLLDLSVVTAPRSLAHFDWTFTAPDLDGNPATADPCDRNGDGDGLECGEAGRNGDGRRLNFASYVAFADVGGTLYLITVDGNLAGGIRVWVVTDVLNACPGEDPAGCPNDQQLNNASGPPWPTVDSTPHAAFFQLDDCPLAASTVFVKDEMLFVSYHEAGVHVIDLAAQGLPDTAVSRTPFEMTAMEYYDTLPGDSDTILENFPCHPLGASDGCESQAADWNPTPCQASPPANAAFRVVRNAGLRSATAVTWAGCHVYVADQGSPDADGLPAPSHVGTPPGLWILDFDAIPDATRDTLRLARDSRDLTAVALSWAGGASLAMEHHVHRGTLPIRVPPGYDHECVLRLTGSSASLAGEVGGTAPRGLYYLVSGACGTQEGELGSDSSGSPILAGAAPCP